jgi:hypothetical protein
MYTDAKIEITTNPATQHICVGVRGHGVFAFRLQSPNNQPLTHDQILNYASDLFKDIAFACDEERTDNRYQAIEDLMRRERKA